MEDLVLFALILLTIGLVQPLFLKLFGLKNNFKKTSSYILLSTLIFISLGFIFWKNSYYLIGFSISIGIGLGFIFSIFQLLKVFISKKIDKAKSKLNQKQFDELANRPENLRRKSNKQKSN